MERMNADSVDRVRKRLLACVADWLPESHSLPLSQAAGKVVSKHIYVEENVPSFFRSTVEGYAVVAADTQPAGESRPVFLDLTAAPKGDPAASCAVESGQCVYVHKGSMLPPGADGVADSEAAEPLDRSIAIRRPVAHGENVAPQGVDAAAGALLLSRGTLLAPQHIGAMAAVGIREVPVFRPLALGVISAGDELAQPGKAPGPGQIRDINSPALSALGEQHGYAMAFSAVVRDDKDQLTQAVAQAMEQCDVVVVCGGSSPVHREAVRKVFNRVSTPGMFAQGIALKPGKHTALAWDKGSRTILAGLPGHPVSALVVFDLLLCWLSRKHTGTGPPPRVTAQIGEAVAASGSGRTICQPVKLTWTGTGYTALPVRGISGLVPSLTQMDGYILLSPEQESVKAGEWVPVRMF